MGECEEKGEKRLAMKRIKKIKYKINKDNTALTEVNKLFDDDSYVYENYSTNLSCMKNDKDICFKNLLIRSFDKNTINFEMISLKFENCIFINELDLCFSGETNFSIEFNNCIFETDFTLFGDFRNRVFINNSVFMGGQINFQESYFNCFSFAYNTLYDAEVVFQEAEFYEEEISFNEIKAVNSKMLFINTYFYNTKLLNFLGFNSSQNSHILFRLVNLCANEVRLFNSSLEHLEFSECTINIDRFEFHCSCETLIFQDCVNDGEVKLTELKGLMNLNLVGFINRGTIYLHDNIQMMINATLTKKNLKWENGNIYRGFNKAENLLQLNFIKEHCPSKTKLNISKLQNEIDNLEKNRVFVSYNKKNKILTENIIRYLKNANIVVYQDVDNLDLLECIEDFQRKISISDITIIVIGEDYFKSRFCMIEMNILVKDPSYIYRIVPITEYMSEQITESQMEEIIEYWERQLKTETSESLKNEYQDTILNVKNYIESINAAINLKYINDEMNEESKLRFKKLIDNLK